jgi:hypothetical protein
MPLMTKPGVTAITSELSSRTCAVMKSAILVGDLEDFRNVEPDIFGCCHRVRIIRAMQDARTAPLIGYTITGTLTLSDQMFMSPRISAPTHNNGSRDFACS